MKEILLPTKKTQDEIKASTDQISNDTAKLIKESATQEGIDAILEILNSAPTGVVKSVQRGMFDGDDSRDAQTVSIEKVDPNKTFVFASNVGSFTTLTINNIHDGGQSETGYVTLSGSGEELFIKAPWRSLKDGSQIRFPETAYLYWQVIEFY